MRASRRGAGGPPIRRAGACFTARAAWTGTGRRSQAWSLSRALRLRPVGAPRSSGRIRRWISKISAPSPTRLFFASVRGLTDDAIGYDDTQSTLSKLRWRAAGRLLLLAPAAITGCALLISLDWPCPLRALGSTASHLGDGFDLHID